MKTVDSIDSLNKVQTILQDKAMNRNSVATKLCHFVFDLILLSGLVYYGWLTYKDWNYWQGAPVPFNLFIVVQYSILAMTIRLPITSSISSTSATKLTVVLCLILFVNTIVGGIWLRQLTAPTLNDNDEVIPAPAGSFDLKD